MAKKMTIFTWVRDKDGKIKGKYALRQVTVSSNFEGIDKKFGRAILPIFRKLAKDLEPGFEGIDIVDV